MEQNVVRAAQLETFTTRAEVKSSALATRDPLYCSPGAEFQKPILGEKDAQLNLMVICKCTKAL